MSVRCALEPSHDPRLAQFYVVQFAEASSGAVHPREGTGRPEDQAEGSQSQKSSYFGPQCWSSRGACGPVTSGGLQHICQCWKAARVKTRRRRSKVPAHPRVEVYDQNHMMDV